MADRSPADAILERELAAVGRDLGFPPTPSLGSAVTARLLADRSRPTFPRLAIWGRRRVLVLAAIGLLALLGLAFGARLLLGAAEIRVQPDATPSGPPLGPGGLGAPVPVESASAAVGFTVAVPAGSQPDEAYVVETEPGRAVLLAWRPSERYPALPGTPWGLVLMELVGDEGQLVKDVQRPEDVREIEVGGQRGVWIDAPHRLLVITAAGEETFSVRGGVLIWTEGGITFRLETSLHLAAATALAETIG